MKLFALIFLFYIILDTIYVYVKLLVVIKYIKSSKKKMSYSSERGNVAIHILIPVLREGQIIEECVKNFSNLNGHYTLHFITTEKEAFEHPFGNNPTKEKLIDLQNKYSNFNIIHYPKIKGIMSHQLNYAFEQLKKKEIIKETDYILVYNADSYVDKDVVVNMSKFLCLHNNPTIVHQPSVFLTNYNSFSGWYAPLLKNIALLQSRWTFVHEIPRILFSSMDNIIRFFESGHLVGHGMLIKCETLEKFGGFLTKYRNEDLPMGYALSNLGEKIIVYPFLENAESPRTLSQVVRQYTTWFYGAFGYMRYMLDLLRTRPNMSFRAISTAVVNQYRSFVWLLSGVLWIVSCIFFIYLGMYWALVILLILYYLSHVYVYKIILNTLKKSTQLNFLNIRKVSISLIEILVSPIAYLLHTLGPVRAIIQMILSKFTGKKFIKEKTERV